jgi:ribosomal protein L37E
MNYPLLTIYADLLDDLERSRIATENRLRAVRDVKGLAGSPEEERLDAIAMGLAVAERQATNELRKAVKAHPLGPWVGAQMGVGVKQAGRLLGVLGDPAHRFDPETGEVVPRTVSQLWSYCGYGDASRQRRRRGEKANWNADLKTRAYLIAESCIKQVGKGSPYRAVYDEARAKYADAVHAEECRRCGPSGSPAPAGSPLSDGHKHARALRAVAKTFLRDLWEEARRVQMHDDAHRLVDPAPDLQGAA